jgi:prephenate dehydratase
MRAGYLGPPGTFSHEALLGLPGAEAREPVALGSIHAAVLAVEQGEVDAALVPIENSVEGSVNVTLDALALEAPGVEIAGEVVHPVHHCLVAREEMDLRDVGYVLSHPQGTAQCAAFLRRELPGAVVLPAASTAEAVRSVAEGERPGPAGVGAAIGSRAAAELYGARILRAGVEDDAGNETRFVWLAPAGSPRLPGDGPWKTALVFWGAGSASPGWLVRCLSEFAFRGVNMTRIESRPRRDLGIGEYMFFADVDGAGSDDPVAEAVAGLRAHAQVVRVLGSFPAAA